MKRYVKHKNYISVLSVTVAASLLLSGCAVSLPFQESAKTEQGEQEFTPETLGLTPDFSYERQAERPGIRIDTLGYLPGSAKAAVFQGKELPAKFQVISKDSRECVYEGDIRAGGAGADGAFTGYGTFTELKKEGNYYIRCDGLGYSYSFTIGKEIYLEKEKQLGSLIEEARNRRDESGKEIARETKEICEMLSYLLAAYEMYPALSVKIWDDGSAGGKETGISGEKFFRTLRAETDLLLTIQDEKTGGIYQEAKTESSTEEGGQPEISAEATAVYAGIMAKYSYLYQEYDWDYANICLKAAAKAWRYLEKEERRGRLDKGGVETGRIYAAAELYRASNERAYHNYIVQNIELMTDRKEDIYLLIGKVTYLSTRRDVDRDLCGQIMKGLMESAARIAAEGKTESFLIEERKTDVILWDMTVLALTNYAIMNHEYVTVIENYLHYLSGRNKMSALLLEEADSVEAAKLLLLFGVVEAERMIVEESIEEESA